jgi:hypothetical protein
MAATKYQTENLVCSFFLLSISSPLNRVGCDFEAIRHEQLRIRVEKFERAWSQESMSWANFLGCHLPPILSFGATMRVLANN